MVCRYRRDAAAMAMSHAEVRAAWQTAVQAAGLPVSADKRAIVMGPPLPAGATSEDERVLCEFTEPCEPHEVAERLNAQLPAGLRVEAAWVARPGTPDEHPAGFDEAVYELCWQDAPPLGELSARLREFFSASDVPLVRLREKKTQRFNARALVRDLQLLVGRSHPTCLQLRLAIGPQGTLRPEEVLQALGYTPAAGSVSVHRVAVFPSTWRASRLAQAWQRHCQS